MEFENSPSQVHVPGAIFQTSHRVTGTPGCFWNHFNPFLASRENCRSRVDTFLRFGLSIARLLAARQNKHPFWCLPSARSGQLPMQCRELRSTASCLNSPFPSLSQLLASPRDGIRPSEPPSDFHGSRHALKPIPSRLFIHRSSCWPTALHRSRFDVHFARTNPLGDRELCRSWHLLRAESLAGSSHSTAAARANAVGHRR